MNASIRLIAGAIVFLAIAIGALGEGKAATTTGNYSSISPTRQIIASWPAGGSKVTFFNVNTGASVSYTAPFVVRTATFSLSERFVCIDGRMPKWQAIVLDREQQLRKVISTKGDARNGPYCFTPENTNYPSPNLPITSRTDNLIMIGVQKPREPDGCGVGTPKWTDYFSQFWDPLPARPKLILQVLYSQSSC